MAVLRYDRHILGLPGGGPTATGHNLIIDICEGDRKKITVFCDHLRKDIAQHHGLWLSEVFDSAGDLVRAEDWQVPVKASGDLIRH